MTNLVPYLGNLTTPQKRLVLACVKSEKHHTHIHLGSLPFVDRNKAVITVYLLYKRFRIRDEVEAFLKKLGLIRLLYRPNVDVAVLEMDTGSLLEIPASMETLIDVRDVSPILLDLSTYPAFWSNIGKK